MPATPGLSPRAVTGARLLTTVLAMVVALAVVAGACSDDGGGDAGPASSVSSLVTLPEELAPTSTTSSPPSPGHGVGSTTTRPPAPGAVSLDESAFVVAAPLSCRGETVVVPVRWSARNVARAVLLVDNVQVPGEVPPEGPFELELPCDGQAHTVVLVVVGADGSTVLSTRAVVSADEG
jgi:hypothetical protein